VVVEIKDNVIWTKHIHGDPALIERLTRLDEGEIREFKVDGYRGPWEKMADGPSGQPTNGFKAVGKARKRWLELQGHRGEVVTFELVSN
jgi:hypothetical protein